MTRNERHSEAHRLLTEAAACAMVGREQLAIDRARAAITQLKLAQRGGSTIGAGGNSPRSNVGLGRDA